MILAFVFCGFVVLKLPISIQYLIDNDEDDDESVDRNDLDDG